MDAQHAAGVGQDELQAVPGQGRVQGQVGAAGPQHPEDDAGGLDRVAQGHGDPRLGADSQATEPEGQVVGAPVQLRRRDAPVTVDDCR